VAGQIPNKLRAGLTWRSTYQSLFRVTDMLEGFYPGVSDALVFCRIAPFARPNTPPGTTPDANITLLLISGWDCVLVIYRIFRGAKGEKQPSITSSLDRKSRVRPGSEAHDYERFVPRRSGSLAGKASETGDLMGDRRERRGFKNSCALG
jgi:hypothetical protein